MQQSNQAALPVLILSAGEISTKLPNIPLSRESPAFLPINSKLLGHLVLEEYTSQERKIYIAINDYDELAFEQEFHGVAGDIEIIPISDSTSVIDSLEKSLEKVSEESLIINIMTSIPSRVLSKPGEILLEKEAKTKENWSAIKKNGIGLQFITKKARVSFETHAFTGIFSAKKSDILKASNELSSREKTDLIYLLEKLHQTKEFELIEDEWFDCGHIANYFRTRRKIFGSRHFNSIAIDEKLGVLIKSSTNKDKLQKEFSYIHKLPEKLKIFYPRAVEFEEQNEKALMKMEYYGYPTLAEIMLHWDLPLSLWKEVFGRLHAILNEFSKSPSNSNQIAGFKEIYENKLTKRVEDFRGQLPESHVASLLDSEKVMVNGEELIGWPSIEKLVSKNAERLYTKEDSCVIHGDYCFNNILGDPFAGILKLIDPRGSFGNDETSIYGDRKYDWAKWAHSVVGRYDYIVNDLFAVQKTEDGWMLEIFDRPWQQQLDDLFWEEIDKTDLNKRDITFIMSTLFLSMTPLHCDKPDRQIAMWLIGLKFFNQIEIQNG